MLAINDATADAMLGTPDSDLWHNDMDNLLHNVNDLMRRLDQRQAEAGSDDAEQEEGGGVFFNHESGGAAEAAPAASSTHTETQVHHSCPCSATVPVQCLYSMWRSEGGFFFASLHPSSSLLLQLNLASFVSIFCWLYACFFCVDTCAVLL